MHIPSLSIITLLLSLTTTITAAPAAIPDSDLDVPKGTTHAARSVSEILALKSAAMKKQAEMKRKRDEKEVMGLW